MKRPGIALIAFAAACVFPPCAWANAGTPLMWAGMLHLAVGNALIGVLEGLVVASMSGARQSKAIVVMIVGNYLSAWLGGLFLRGAIVAALPMDLNNGWLWFWIMVAVTFLLTLLIEWPFVARLFREDPQPWHRSLRASLLVQGGSYLLLFGWYWMASGTSLYTKMHIVPPGELSLPELVVVCYIRPADGDVYRRALTGTGEEKVFDLQSTDDDDRLFVRPNTADTNRWDLMARLETEDHRNPKLVPVLTNLLADAAPDWRTLNTNPGNPSRYEGTWFNFGEVQRLEAAAGSPWKFQAGFWPVEGLRGSHATTGERVHFAFETPFGAWAVRNAVQLPKDKVLFQLGHDQICAFDPASRRVALLWHGRGPVPMIPGNGERPVDARPSP